ncbi:MAG: EAL domain-containing protein, partial [Spirochaetaceae bacterium]|nr:EAL domain-containing protein [Spirochaetaceae bacterium]
MNTTLSGKWLERLSSLDHALQPIARFASGEAYGFEALLRGWDRAGFADIASVFDLAFEEKVLYALDLALRRKAFAKFRAAAPAAAKLFYNVDNRLLEMPDYATGNTLAIARETGLSPSRIVIELSELHEPAERTGFDRVVDSYRRQGFRIALDDFGSGYAGLKFLHRAEPDIVKIDRYFVASCGEDPRKAAFLEKIASMAHLMGISVVAEGIETEREFQTCAEAGCDFAQGFFVARPTLEAAGIRGNYASPAMARGAASPERRAPGQAGVVGGDRLSETEEVEVGVALPEVLARFRKDPGISLLPVVDGNGEVVGVYRERDFREYVYSPYGIAILEHLAADSGGQALLFKAPVAPIGADLARVVELYGASPDSGGVVMTEAGRYAGIHRAEDL